MPIDDEVHLRRGDVQNAARLRNFYMVGRWVEPGGGVPASAISGRQVVKRLCKQDGKKFGTTEG
jgi:phytoene dehydrogenase-like protein